MKIHKYRVDKSYLDGEPHYKIQVLSFFGIMYIDLDVTSPTNDVSVIEGRLKQLEDTQICIIDRDELL